uniref:ATP-dependent DNA helicase n=1 Tax=Fusarium oxysporum (strain Fo5176) TaxID=660025 RepID=A0A0D2YI28_FUSOF
MGRWMPGSGVLSGKSDPIADATGSHSTDRNGEHNAAGYRPDGIGTATRLIDETALASEEGLNAAIILNDGLSPPQGTVSSTGTPRQEQLRAIKSQQISLSRDREKAFQGMQSWPGATIPIDRATARGGSEDLEQQNGQAATADWMEDTNPSTSIMFGLFTSFCEVRRQVAKSLTPNRRQSIAFWLICRQLDQVRRDEHCTAQLCLFIGGNGGTGKSRVIAAIAELFAVACNFSRDTSTRTGAPSSSAGRRIDGQAKMDWQEKYALIIDEVGMLGARMLYAVNVQLRRLRESTEDFGDIPVIIFCGDFHQFRPVQEWSILLPSSSFPRGQGHGFGLEQQRQHDVAYVLWRKFTVVVPKEKVRAAQDPRLRRLITRVEFLNSNGYHEERRIPWESEATLAFQRQRHAPLHTFVSEHKWKDGIMLLTPLSRCRSLDGIMLLSEARDRDFVGNVVPVEMAQAELRLEEMSEQTVRQTESMIWSEANTGDWCRADVAEER